MKPFMHAACAAIAVLCLCAPIAARAGVVIAGTRVVFPAKQGEVTVRLSNQNDRPVLVEAWIDTGDLNSTPNSVNTPFLITPPLFRMESNKEQSLRIIYTQGSQPLPADRESLFWLNVLEIPPKPAGPQSAGHNYLQFAIRSRLKFFYRPANLQGDATKAPDTLSFTAQGTTLDVRNPTPYYVTISKLSLGANGNPIDGASGMVAPLGDLRVALKGLTQAPSAGTPVVFTTINDYGATDTHKSTVTQ
ncbi:molecular chaperone [Rhodanobacter sp. MP7CTX1]|jgi:P pilus assembly chaperone PapD|uniref:fimbrial biogenesis chaperone n=1 Tax=Rhodanobacter sp. MP7CTX1 TaxID=2723084 RepID=UPI001616FD90|nr:molecular chaperone [Rhodanobacter sp. MP7CTX1]MBB6188276.1 chaperone protein EcpD [Rhodanobacter sp. MP7CTX1]